MFNEFQLELRDESQRYRAYLEQRKIDEERQQKDLERVIQIELDKQNAKRAAKARTEQEKREKLLQEVLAGRQEQLTIQSKRKMSRIFFRFMSLTNSFRRAKKSTSSRISMAEGSNQTDYGSRSC